MLSLVTAQAQIADRGPHYAVVGTIRRDEMRMQYADTATRAAQIAEAMRADGLRQVRLHPPLAGVDHPAVARRLADATAELHAARAEGSAAAHRLVEAGVSEVETAHLLGVDRMTVRRWLGKPRSG